MVSIESAVKDLNKSSLFSDSNPFLKQAIEWEEQHSTLMTTPGELVILLEELQRIRDLEKPFAKLGKKANVYNLTNEEMIEKIGEVFGRNSIEYYNIRNYSKADNFAVSIIYKQMIERGLCDTKEQLDKLKQKLDTLTGLLGTEPDNQYDVEREER